MTRDDIRRVQESFVLLQGEADRLGLTFYECLFATHPELRGMFPEDVAPQAKKLVQMLAMLVVGLDRLDSLLPAIEALARRHAGYGVRPEHYAIVGRTLLWTLAQGLGPAFTDEIRSSWSAAFSILSSVMIAVSTESV